MPSNHLILCHPLLLLPSIFPSIRVFSNESALHIKWPQYWSFGFSLSPCNEYAGFRISFRTDRFDLLAVHLLQHNNSKVSVLRCSAFFMVQLSHPYRTTGKTIATRGGSEVGIGKGKRGFHMVKNECLFRLQPIFLISKPYLLVLCRMVFPNSQLN